MSSSSSSHAQAAGRAPCTWTSRPACQGAATPAGLGSLTCQVLIASPRLLHLSSSRAPSQARHLQAQMALCLAASSRLTSSRQQQPAATSAALQCRLRHLSSSSSRVMCLARR
jgi:hypothetical protein